MIPAAFIEAQAVSAEPRKAYRREPKLDTINLDARKFNPQKDIRKRVETLEDLRQAYRHFAHIDRRGGLQFGRWSVPEGRDSVIWGAYESGATFGEIANYLGVSGTVVSNAIDRERKRLGIPGDLRKSRYAVPQKPDDKTLDRLIDHIEKTRAPGGRAHISEKLRKQIAKYYGNHAYTRGELRLWLGISDNAVRHACAGVKNKGPERPAKAWKSWSEKAVATPAPENDPEFIALERLIEYHRKTYPGRHFKQEESREAVRRFYACHSYSTLQIAIWLRASSETIKEICKGVKKEKSA